MSSGVFYEALGFAELSFFGTSFWCCQCWMLTVPNIPIHFPPSFSLPTCRDNTKPSTSFKRTAASNIDYTELLQHFEKVQNKHLEARHQRAGQAEQLDRRVVL